MNYKYSPLLFGFFVLLALVFSGGAGLQANEISISVDYAQQNGTPLVRLQVDIAAPYHAYAHIPGATGKPTVLRLRSTETAPLAYTVRYPAGISQKDIFDPRKTVRVYEGNVALYIAMPGAKAGQEVSGQLDALLCSDQHCLPVSQALNFTLPRFPLPALANTAWAASYAAARPGSLPQALPPLSSVHPAPSPSSATLAQASASPIPLLPLSGGTSASVEIPTTKTPQAQGTQKAKQPPVSSHTPLPLIPLGAAAAAASPSADLGSLELSPRYFEEFTEVSSLSKALLLGLLAGLLLNVMPCVLPVLTMKGSALLLMGGGDSQERFRRFREHSLLFAAGIMTLFLFLALVLGMAGMMWGQLFQNTHVILGMLIVIFLLGLSMLGVFTLPVIDLKASQSSSPRMQAYFTGIMATLLATPCSGPLLGGVLGWAFTQPLPILITVFLAVGLGMCAPYIVFAIRPQLVTILPKPGPWMGVLERLVGFFLLGTSVYLLSILPPTQYIAVLAVLLLVAVCAWLYGRFASYDAPQWRRTLLPLASALVVFLVLYQSLWAPIVPTRWEDFTPESFTEMLGKEALVVEFTADWCPNCKLLEQTTLTEKNLQRWYARYGMRFVRVDLTRENPPAQELLRSLGSSSIPLTALFPAGDMAHSPMVLRDIYSKQSMDKALQKTFLPKK